MKFKVIICCVLFFCSKFVDSISYSEDLVRQRAYQRQVNQNKQYHDTNLVQIRNDDTSTNSGIKQDNIQQFYTNQESYNYDSDEYNNNPALSQSEKEFLVNFDSTPGDRILDSYAPRVGSYLSRTSQVRTDNQQYRNQNANSVPSTDLIPDSEKPLVTPVQEPYRRTVKYLQPKNTPSSNRGYEIVDRLAIKKQHQYPLEDNSGENKYVVNSVPRFGSNGPISYDSYSKEQAETSEIKATSTASRRYEQNSIPQSGIIYNETPAVISTESLADQTDINKYNLGDNKHVVNFPPWIRYGGPVPYDNYSKEPLAISEIKARPTGSQRYVHNSRSQAEIIHNETPAVIATDALADQFENIKYDSGDKQYVVHSPPHFETNGPILSFDNYSKEQAAATSDIKPRPTRNRSYMQSIVPQSKIVYNAAPAVIATDTLIDKAGNNKYNFDDNDYALNFPRRLGLNSNTPFNSDSEEQAAAISDIQAKSRGSYRYLQISAPQSGKTNNEVLAVIGADTRTEADQSENMKNIEKIKFRSDLSKTLPIANNGNSASVKFSADRHNLDSIQENLAPIKKPLVLRNANNYRSHSEWNYNARDDSSENIEVKSRKYESTDTVSNKYDDSKVPHHGANRPTPLNDNLSRNVYHKLPSGIREYNFKSIISNPQIEKIAANKRSFVVVHPNGTVEHVDELNLDSHQNLKFRLVAGDRVITTQSPVDVPINIANTTKPMDEYLLPENKKPVDNKNPFILDVNQSGENDNAEPLSVYNQPIDKNYSNPFSQFEDLPDDSTYFKPFPVNVKQPTDDKISKKLPPLVNETADDDNSKPLPQGVNQPAKDTNPKLFLQHLRHLEHVEHLKPKYSYENQLKDDNNFKPFSLSKNHPDDDYDYKQFPSYKIQPGHINKSQHLSVHQSEDDDKTMLPFYKTPPGHNNSEPLPQYPTHQLTHHNKLKVINLSDVAVDDNDSKPPYVSQLTHDNKSKHYYKIRPAQVKSELSSSNEHQFIDDKNPLLPQNVSQSVNDKKSKLLTLAESQPESDKNLKLLPSYENSPEDEGDFEQLPLENLPSHRNKSKSKHLNDVPADDHSSKLLPQYEIQPTDEEKPKPSNEIQTDNDDSEPLAVYLHQPAPNNKLKSKNTNKNNLTGDDNSEPLPLSENLPENDNKSKTKHLYESKPGDENLEPLASDGQREDDNYESLMPYVNQQTHRNKSNSNHSRVHQPADDKKSRPMSSDENQSENDDNVELLPYVNQPAYGKITSKSNQKHASQPAVDDNSKRLPSFENQLEDDIKFKSKHALKSQPASDKSVASHKNHPENDLNSKPSPLVINNNVNQSTPQVTKNHKHRHRHIRYKPSTNPPVATTTPYPDDIEDEIITLSPLEQTTNNVSDVPPVTTTSKTTTRHQSLGKANNTKDKQDDDVQAESSFAEDVASMSNKVQTYSLNTIPSSSASPVVRETEIETVIYENNQANNKTDINHHNNKRNDIKMDADDDDSFNDEKTSMANIHTKNDSDENYEIEDCLNNDVIKKDSEIDLEGEPKMLVKTSNQDFFDELMDDNDADIDVIYIFQLENQPVIERETETTRFCNGTVLIETTEITYQHNNDSTPTIVKTTKVIKSED